jgi:hypothetical protein
MYRLYRVGERMEPCGTPACIFRGVDSSPSTITLNFQWERNELISLIKLGEKCNSESLYSKPGCHMVSNAFSISKKTAVMDMLLKFKFTWSVNRIHWSVVLWRARKPNWHGFSTLFPSTCLWIILRMTFSKISSVVVRRHSGLRFWGSFGSLPGFDKAITLLPSRTMESAIALSSGWIHGLGELMALEEVI